MTLINQLVKAAYAGDLTIVKKNLLTNMDVNCRAEYPCANVEKIDGESISYPSEARFKKLHPSKWNCAVWREENLNTFTPLAAAILGKQQDMVSWLLQEGCADAEVVVTAYSYGKNGSFWSEKITNLNMLNLAIFVGNTKILHVICQYLKQKDMLQNQAVNMANLEHNKDITQVNAFGMMEQLNDTDNLKVFLSYFAWSSEAINETLKSVVQRLNDRDCELVKTYAQEIIRLTSQNIISESILQSDIIYLAFKNDKIELCKYFMSLLSLEQQRQGLIRIQDYDGCPLLHNAVILKNMVMIGLLCNEQNDVNFLDAKGNTPLHTALLLSDCPTNIMSTLIKHGAAIDIKNSAQKTALDLCRQPIMKRHLITERSRFENKYFKDDLVSQTTGLFVPTDTAAAAPMAMDMDTVLPTSPSGCCIPFLSFSRNKKKYSEPAGKRNVLSEEREYETNALSLL